MHERRKAFVPYRLNAVRAVWILRCREFSFDIILRFQFSFEKYTNLRKQVEQSFCRSFEVRRFPNTSVYGDNHINSIKQTVENIFFFNESYKVVSL